MEVKQPPLATPVVEQQQVSVTCPEKNSPGDQIMITYNGQQYYVTVPEGVLPGEQFVAAIGSG